MNNLKDTDSYSKDSWFEQRELDLEAKKFEAKAGSVLFWVAVGLIVLFAVLSYWDNGHTLGRLSEPVVGGGGKIMTVLLLYFATTLTLDWKRVKIERKTGKTIGMFTGQYIFLGLMTALLLSFFPQSQDARLARKITANMNIVESKYDITPPAGTQALEWLKNKEMAKANRGQISLIAQSSVEDRHVLSFLLAEKAGISTEEIQFVVQNRMVRPNDRSMLAGTLKQHRRKSQDKLAADQEKPQYPYRQPSP